MFETTYSFQEYFSKIMKWMFGGLFLTFVTSLIATLVCVYGDAAWSSAFLIVSMIGCIVELILVFKIRKDIQKLDHEQARNHFIAYSIVSGLSLGVICTFYEPFAIVLAFAITCAYFGLLHSITKVVNTDFSYLGRICVSALIPLIIGSIILMFIHAPSLYWFLTIGGIAIFTGLTLWDFKRIESSYAMITEESQDVMIVYMALELYLDFMNLFLYILRLMRKK